jgi:hypothetical protein
MKTSSEGPREFQNRLLRIGRRASGTMESLELRDIVSGMKRELDGLLRENISLRVSDTSEAVGGIKAVRCDIEDLIRHLVLDARDAMPAGGELCIITGTVVLDAIMRGHIRRFHPAITPCSPSATRATGQTRKASMRSRAKPSFARVEASDSPPATMSSINSEGISVCRGIAHETVVKIYVPCAGETPAHC